MIRRLRMLVLLAALMGGMTALAQTHLRITWYNDGNEGQVLQDLLNKFEAQNPDITVTLDTVSYAQGILQSLPLQLASGQGPDIARVTQLGDLEKYYLDLTPYLKDPSYWETNFGPFLDWMRPAGSKAIPGYMTQLTVTGPFVNKTLFDQAGIPLPQGDTTWQQWADVTRKVAKATGTPFAMAMDRSGHRFAGPAVSMGAKFFDAQGKPKIDDPGFRDMAKLLVQWNKDGTMDPSVWIGNGGQYAAGNQDFINGQIVFYMSGSWQISQFASKIGNAFDWVAVPNPCGPAACTGMPGGAALVALKETKHPEAVAKLMEFLAQPDNLAEFYARTLFIPGSLGLAKKGIDFQTDNQNAKAALQVFSSQVSKLAPLAYKLQAYKYNTTYFNAIRDRLTQVMVGELTMDQAVQRIQQDIDEQLKAAGQ